MIDWKRKLCSRKFWLAVIGLVSGLLLAFKVDAETVETISGVVMSVGSVVAYIIGEGMTDAANINAETIKIEKLLYDDEDDGEEDNGTEE